MPPNRDEVAAVGANPGSRSVETPTFVADFCLIDDPREYEDQLGELDAEDEAERPVRFIPAGRGPHFIKRVGRRSGTYVRVGSTNRQADAQLIDEMRRFAIGEAFDEWPMSEVNSEALDFRLASESFAPVRKLTRRNLETLCFPSA